MFFTGEFEHTIDSKGRVAVPREVRGVLDPAVHGDGFYLTPDGESGLELWPRKTFEAMVGSMKSEMVADMDVRSWETLVFSTATALSLDSSGRIRLPEKHLKRAGIKGKVVILGIRDHLELRQPEEWEVEREAMFKQAGEIMRRARKAMTTQSSNESSPRREER